jgi:Fe2+ or Zn2+ uptake regulation protein
MEVEDHKEENSDQLIQLSDGKTTLNKYCYEKQFNHEVGIETIYDLLDVLTKLTRIEVVKNEDGFVTDVELHIPHCNDVLVIMAQNNLLDFHEFKIQKDFKLSDEEFLESRRYKLEKMISEETI